MDNINEHIEEIQAQTNMPKQTLIRQNSTKKSDYTNYYTPVLIEKVRRRFQLDIDFFGFEFGKKGATFPFGFLDTPLLERFQSPDILMPILQEKNKELIGIQKKMTLELEKKEVDLEKNIKQNNDLEYNIGAMKESLSWKITSPLRTAIAKFK